MSEHDNPGPEASSFQEAASPSDLQLVMGKLAEFEREFCRLMYGGVDYTLRLEVRGNAGKVIHTRVSTDNFEHPQEQKKPSEQ